MSEETDQEEKLSPEEEAHKETIWSRIEEKLQFNDVVVNGGSGDDNLIIEEQNHGAAHKGDSFQLKLKF